jgi:hypothetical protein
MKSRVAVTVCACVFLIESVGFLTCILCHGMQRESPRNPENRGGDRSASMQPEKQLRSRPVKRVQYFGGFASDYRIPFTPTEPLTEAEARARRAYYVGEYDDAGNLLSFTKYLDGKLAFKAEYTYGVDGIPIKSKMTKSDGTIFESPLDAGQVLFKSNALRVLSTVDFPNRLNCGVYVGRNPSVHFETKGGPQHVEEAIVVTESATVEMLRKETEKDSYSLGLFLKAADGSTLGLLDLNCDGQWDVKCKNVLWGPAFIRFGNEWLKVDTFDGLKTTKPTARRGEEKFQFSHGAWIKQRSQRSESK